jgi:hypothetical protein
MENQFQIPRTLLVYAIAIPLALVLGFFLIDPNNLLTWMVVGLLLFVGILPWILKHHHKALIIGWGAFVNVFFLPGQPPFWLLLAVLSLGVSLLGVIVIGKKRFASVPVLTWPFLFIVVVVAVTAICRGGIGIRALGGESFGGKSYLLLLGAIIGYFALSAQTITKKEAGFLIAAYFIGSTTALFGNAAYALGPSFYFLFNLFPTDFVISQVQYDYLTTSLERIVGLSVAASGVYCFLLARFGIRGIFDLRKPWRLALFVLTCLALLWGGFRSFVIWAGLLFAFQFHLEKLWRTKMLAIMLGLAAIFSVVLVGAIHKMPVSVQRTFSFLPLDVDPIAKGDAVASTEWRMDMWRVLVDQIPTYFWLGKGYVIDPTDLYFADEAVRRGIAKNYETALIAGDYHSGPLSTIIPMGIWGVIGFIWLAMAGLFVLYRNYKYGDPEMARINTLLLAFFAARTVFFIFVFGAFNTELHTFTGILGLSVSLNAGVRSASRSRVAAKSAPKLIAHPLPQPA